MEKIQKLLEWMKGKPWWIKLIASIVIAAILFILTSCGTPKTTATVHNVNPHSAVTVTMTVSSSNQTDVNTDASASSSVTP